jgi:hypothetical protein
MAQMIADSDQIFNREWTLIHANRLRKNFAGRRCDQKALPQCFLAQPDGLHAVRRVLRSSTVFHSSLLISASIRVIRGRNSSVHISVHQWLKWFVSALFAPFV